MPSAAHLLAADIGGTHARFRHAGRALELTTRDYGGMDSLLAAALEQLKLEGAGLDAALAVAGPVQGNHANLTNLGWRCELEPLRTRFGFRRLAFLNDLEAAARAVAERPPQARLLRAGIAAGRAALISVSTGLGVAYWSRPGGALHVESSEAGHAGFAPGEAWDAQFLRALEQQQVGRVSWERVLSGAGLASLDSYLRQAPALSPEEVVRHAREGDEHALAAVRRLSHLAGVFAGDLVLAAPARGGVWLMGGVLAGLGDLFDGEAFLRGFDAKGRLSPQLAQVPVQLTAEDRLGLEGAWLTAEALHRA